MVCRPHLDVRRTDLRGTLKLSASEAASVLRQLDQAVRVAAKAHPTGLTQAALLKSLGAEARATIHHEGGQAIVCFDFGQSRSPRLRAACWLSVPDAKVYALHIVSSPRWARRAVMEAGLAEARKRLGDILTHYGMKP